MRISAQAFRYIRVGIFTNLFFFLVYLALTGFGLKPVVVVGILYPIGLLISFVSHRQHSFQYDGGFRGPLVRYLIVQGLGYLLNISLMILITDRLGVPHQLALLFNIFLVGGLLYLCMRFYVFSVRD